MNIVLNNIVLVFLLIIANIMPTFAEDNLGFIKKDALYMEVREQLIKKEWHPIDYDENNYDKTVASCLVRVTSGFCTIEKSDISICSQKRELCSELPELEQCSSDGYCNMIFEHKNIDRKIFITTYGDTSLLNRNESLYIIGGGLKND